MYEGGSQHADIGRLIIKTEYIYQFHQSSGMASIPTLAPELQRLIFDNLSIKSLAQIALTSKVHNEIIDNYKASCNAKMSIHAVELSFFDSRVLRGWLCPSETRMWRLKDWIKKDFLLFDYDGGLDLRRAFDCSETAVSERQGRYTDESLWYLDFLKSYSKRLMSHAKWLAMMSRAKKPSVQWDLDSLYEALLLWSTRDWPGVANVMVKVVAQSGQEDSGADRSLAELPLTLQYWLDKAT